MRYKARQPELEGVAWYCPNCDAEVFRQEWALSETLSQEGYQRACEAFNADREKRVCPRCAREHPPLDLSGIRWLEVAEAVRAELLMEVGA
jgi:3-hydroxyanthranilate 3,4-dioxygenase